MDKAQQNLEILEQYFRDGCKLNCVQKLGLEIEHFLVGKIPWKQRLTAGSRGLSPCWRSWLLCIPGNTGREVGCWGCTTTIMP